MEAVIRGTTMPVLEVDLLPGESVVAEAGHIGWFDDGIELQTMTDVAGADNVFEAGLRSLGGGTFFMTRYAATTQAGTVAFPARLPGTIVQVPLGPGRSYLIQRHGFLAAIEGAELTAAVDPGKLGSGFVGGFGFVLQKLEGAGHAWVELAGELTRHDLAPGQSISVHPAHIGLIEQSIEYELTTVPGIMNKLFGDGVFLMRLTGPGRVWLQSMSLELLAHSLLPFLPSTTDGGKVQSSTLEAAAIGGTIGATVRGLGKLL